MNRKSLTARLVAMIGTLVLVAGCGDDTAPTSPATTATVSVDSVQARLDEWAAQGPGGVAVALAAGDDEPLMVAAAGTSGPDGGILEPDAAFRVGSLSKTFVAVMLLQLFAEDTIELDDLVTDHAPELTIADPARPWTPSDVLDLVVDQPRDFPPGEQFAYSNTNYVVAGLLLETLTGTTLADNLESRIVEPLGLTATYFAPDDARSPIGGFSSSLAGGDTNGVSYHALETATGAAGALVSTAFDLAIFIRALAHGELLPETAYAEMIRGLPDHGQTLGVGASDPPSTTGISNSGAIPGFTSYMQYDPATGHVFVLLLNDDSRSPEQLGDDLLEIVRST